MQRTPVSSSDLKSVGYDAASNTLEIEFNSGGVYQYANVPAGTYQGLLNASSKGTYFHQNIKNNYSYRKL